jgi:hypothetical protein
MDKYDIALLRRLRIIDELINSDLNKDDIMVEYVKITIMNEHFNIPLSTIFYDITDEHKELDLKLTNFIKKQTQHILSQCLY